MVNNTERIVGAIVGDHFRNWRSDFSLLNMFLINAGYSIRLITPGDPIPDNLPALFVLGGVEDLDDWALYRIDRYIQLGGKVFFAVNGVHVDIHGTISARNQFDMGLLEMIASYGVIVRPELVLDRSALVMQYQSTSSTGGLQHRIARYPHWIGVLGSNGNIHHPVSAGFAGVDLYWPSPLELLPPDNVEATVLFTSTPEAWLMRERFHTNPEIAYLLELEADQTRGEKNLGISLSGIFPSFFRDSPKPFREGLDEQLPDMPQRANTSRIIVIGDTDFASDIMNATQNISLGEIHNLEFLLRIADWLVNDDDIIGIRGRQAHTGRLDRITDDSRRIRAIRFSQVVNVGLVPLLVIITGIAIAQRRKKIARNAEHKFVKEIPADDQTPCDNGGSDDL
jgi:ABC-type uncharacterized transport system involved in gliding motility auxiliary subunit